MKAIIVENGIDLIPETEFDRDCIAKIMNKTLIAKFQDDWDNKGNMQLRFEMHPWVVGHRDERR